MKLSCRALTFAGLLALVCACDVKPIDDSVAGSVPHVDNTPPLPPTISAPNTTPYIHRSRSPILSISGTATPEVVRILGPNGAVITPNTTGSWSYSVTLANVGTSSYSFLAQDFAGNISIGATGITATWDPSPDWVLGKFESCARAIDGGSGFVLLGSLPPFGGPITDPTTSFQFEVGFPLASKSAGLW